MNDPREQDRLLFLIAANGYAAWRNVLMASGCEAGKRNFDRMRQPQIGDVVLETTTVWRWLKAQSSPGVALGKLLRIEWEPFPRIEGELEPEQTATEQVFYVEPLDRSIPEARWTNASFIALASERENFQG